MVFEVIVVRDDNFISLKEYLVDIKTEVKEIKLKLESHNLEIEKMKFKHGFIGMLGGAISYFVSYATMKFLGKPHL